MTQLELALDPLPRGWYGRCRQPCGSVRSLIDGSLSPAFHWHEQSNGKHVCGGDDFRLEEPPDTIKEFAEWLASTRAR